MTKNKFCLSLHYNGASSYLFVNDTEIYKFKAKYWKLWQLHYPWETVQKTSQQIIWKKLDLMGGYVYDFSSDYDATDVDGIHKYLMKKSNSVNENILIC